MSLRFTHKPDYFFFAQLLMRHVESYIQKHQDASNAIFDLGIFINFSRQTMPLPVLT